jgi:hypothetical protein
MGDNREILELRHNVSDELYTLLYTGFVDSVYAMHEAKAGGFPQGYCGQIAEQIQKQCGGELVAGWLEYGTGRREHWWLEIDNNIVDPMAEEFNKHTPCRHIEAHRNIRERYWIKACV